MFALLKSFFVGGTLGPLVPERRGLATHRPFEARYLQNDPIGIADVPQAGGIKRSHDLVDYYNHNEFSLRKSDQRLKRKDLHDHNQA